MALFSLTTSVWPSFSATRGGDALETPLRADMRLIVYLGINHEGFGLDLGRPEPVSNGLVLAAQRGDRAAFQELVQNYEAVVIRVALNVTGSQDATLQIYCCTFRDAFVSVNQLNPGSSVFIWVYRILVRHCLEHCRRYPHVIETHCSEEDFGCRLRRAIHSLPPTERVILQLKQYQGLKIRTLAEVFNVTPEFVIKSLQDANTHLRRQLKADRQSLPTQAGSCTGTIG
jgi:RNA polymerase sigma-70 factor, ECF subfamily